MGFAERNSMAGRTSSVSFPDAIKRGTSDQATQFTIQITDANGAPNDPDSAELYVRVTNASGTAQDSLLYTDSSLSSAATASTNSTYTNSGSAYWKAVSTSSGSATLYHKTGTASSLEGIYHLEFAWFENSEAVSGSEMFRIIDLADMDTVNTNLGSDSDSASATGSAHAKIKQLSSDVAGLENASTAATADAVWDEASSGHATAGSFGKALSDVLTDTAAMQPIVAALPDSGALTSLATATALATVDTVVDGIQTDLSNTTDGLGAIKALIDTVDTVADGIQTDLSNTTDGLGAIKTAVDAVNTDLGNTTDGLGAIAALVTTVDTVADGIQTDLSNTTDGLGAIKTAVDAVNTDLSNSTDGLGAIAALVTTVDTVADGIQTDLSNTTDGLGALKALIDTVDTVADGIQTDLSNTTDGLGAIKTAVDTANTDLSNTTDGLGAIKTAVDAVNTDLSNSTDGLGAIKTAVDAANTDLSNTTDGLGALKSLIDTVQTSVSAVQNNTRFVATVPGKINRPSSGSEAVSVQCYLYDTSGNMEDADSNAIYVKITQMDGTAIASRYYSNAALTTAISAETSGTFSGYYALTRSASGKYGFFYKNDTGHTEENTIVEFGWEESAAARYQSRAMQVSDAADLDSIDSNVSAIQTDLSNTTDGLGALKSLIDTVDTVADGIQTDLSNTTDGLGAIKTAVDAVNTDLGNTTDGLGAIKALIDTVDTVADGIQTDLSNTTDGLGAIKSAVDTANTDLSNTTDGLGAIKTAVDAVNTDLGNTTDGLGAIKSAVDTANTDLSNTTDGLGAIKTAVDAVNTDLSNTTDGLGAIKTVADGIQTDLSNSTDGLGAIKALIDTVDTVADGIQTDLSNTTDGLGALKSLIDTADAAVDAVQADLGDFSSNTNLQTALAMMGSGFDDRNVSMAVSSLVGDKHLFKVASNAFSAGSGTFVLTKIGTGYATVPSSDDEYLGGGFRVLSGGTVGQDVKVTDYTGSSGTVAYQGATLVNNDIVVFMEGFLNAGKSDDAASSSASDAGQSLFARLRYTAELVASKAGVQRSTFKKYLKRSTSGTLGNDPTDTAESASGTSTATTYKVLDVVTISFDEGSNASVDDVFAVLKWKHQGTASAGSGAMATKWYVSGASTAPSAGDAVSGISDAVAVSDEFAGTTSAATKSVSGLLNDNALSAFSAGKMHILLCGKVTTATDTCTGWIYHSASMEISYSV